MKNGKLKTRWKNMKDNILGFDVLNYRYDEFVDQIFNDLSKKDKHFIVNINPFIIHHKYLVFFYIVHYL